MLCLAFCLAFLLTAVTVLPVDAAPRAVGSNIASGTLTVRSIPGSAAVTLDGVHQGQTPAGNDALVIEGVEPGPHQLVISKHGYLDNVHPFWIGAGQRSEIRLTLTATTGNAGSLSIVSSPSGADVSLDGEYRGRTPLTISSLTPGRHQVALELPGYSRYTTSVEIQNGVMTYLDPVLAKAASVGYISIVSSPSGAFVYVDGTYRGVTPLTVAAPSGTRRVELDRSGYADWSSSVQVSGGTTVYLNAALQTLTSSSTGGIAVASRPVGASVYLDNQYRGVTPNYGDLELTDVSVGSHTLSIRLAGYEEYRITVQVSPDATVKVQPQLTAVGNPTVTVTPTQMADRGAIQANSTPAGARVSIDGQFKGTTPITVTDIPAGQHTVVLSLEGYIEREQALEVRAGQTAMLNANLTPTATQTRTGIPAYAILAALAVASAAVFVRGRRR
jgi:hypothetical protein